MFRPQDSMNLKLIPAIWLINIWDSMLTLIGNMIVFIYYCITW
jgi:hypothetical protein